MAEHKQGGDDTKDLHRKILAWQQWITFFAAALIISYVAYFGLFLGLPSAENSDKWGAFGDFFGGILNPIVAFAAFYWLTQSVKLQKQELAETRLELKGAADAQRELVENGKSSVKLAALTALVNAIDVQISGYQNLNKVKRERLRELQNSESDEDRATCERIADDINDLMYEYRNAIQQKEKYIANMAEILKNHS